MRPAVAVYYIGFVLTFVSLFMLGSALVGTAFHDGSAGLLALSGILVSGFGLFPIVLIPRGGRLTPREGVLVVTGAWVACIVFGAIPFYLHGPPFSVVNALFESFSGFTTTGASILEKVEALPKGLLFWRSLTHWIGGIGIVVFALAILPSFGRVEHVLLRQELSPLATSPSLPKARDVARVIAVVYLSLTALQTVALLAAGLGLFDALTTTFGTVATGGFAVRDGSISAYHSVPVEVIVIVFMVLSGMNFAFLLNLVAARFSWREGWAVARFYLCLLAAGSLIASVAVHGTTYASWGEAIRYGTFQVVALGTSTGFASADSSVWRPAAGTVLVIATFICACAGSTSGGIKVDRILLCLKAARLWIKRSVHPSLVGTIRVGSHTVSPQVVGDAVLFIVLYVSTAALGSLLLAITGVPLTEAFTGTAACLGNVGPGLGSVGSMGNYNALNDLAKIILCGIMLVGRLEILALVLPFTPAFWRR
ncbi:MAG: TrkH family potassium uptake protein [Planctomycetota bacterium]